MRHSPLILLLISSIHTSLQFEPSIAYTDHFISSEDSTNPSQISSTPQPVYKIAIKYHNSDESHSKKINCHTNSQLNTCEVIEDSISSPDYEISSSATNNLNILNFLMINNKKIEFLPLEIGKNFYNLSLIMASGNGIKIITKNELKRLYRLKTLILESNEIEIVKFNAFDELISLEVIDLDNNKIQQLDGKLLSSPMYLKIFSVRNNQLETLHEEIFEHCLRLDTVKLEGNKITQLSHKLLDHVPHVKKVMLEKNSCVDKNYEGGKIVSTFAVDMSKMCDGSEIEVSNNFLNFAVGILIFLIISILIGGIAYKFYKSKKWQVRSTTMDAFENPHYSIDPEKPQGSNLDSYHEFQNKKINDEARYGNLPAVKCDEVKIAAVRSDEVKDHVYEEVQEDKEKVKDCCENPNYE